MTGRRIDVRPQAGGYQPTSSTKKRARMIYSFIRGPSTPGEREAAFLKLRDYAEDTGLTVTEFLTACREDPAHWSAFAGDGPSEEALAAEISAREVKRGQPKKGLPAERAVRAKYDIAVAGISSGSRNAGRDRIAAWAASAGLDLEAFLRRYGLDPAPYAAAWQADGCSGEVIPRVRVLAPSRRDAGGSLVGHLAS